MNDVMILSETKKQEFLLSEIRKIKRYYFYLSCIPVSITILFVVLNEIAYKGEKWFISVIAVMLLGVANVLRAVWALKAKIRETEDMMQGEVLYAEISPVFDAPVEFVTWEGKVIKTTFDSEKYVKLTGEEKVRVFYNSTKDCWMIKAME